VPEDASVEEGGDAPVELKRTFWSIVVILDVAMVATALGALLVAFEGRWLLGGAVLLVGLLGFGESYRRVRARRKA
jgi:hypothetical protein